MARAIQGLPVAEALKIAQFSERKAANQLEKTIRSAVANADHNQNLDVDSLIIRNIVVDQGPMLKRFSARARGRGTRILKRTSHITVILAEGNE